VGNNSQSTDDQATRQTKRYSWDVLYSDNDGAGSGSDVLRVAHDNPGSCITTEHVHDTHGQSIPTRMQASGLSVSVAFFFPSLSARY